MVFPHKMFCNIPIGNGAKPSLQLTNHSNVFTDGASTSTSTSSYNIFIDAVW